MIAALLLAAATPVAAKVDAVVVQSGLAGEVLVAKGDRVLLDKSYGTVDPRGGAKHRAGGRWRLASITKQVSAAMLLRDHLAVLDQPVVRIDHEPSAGHMLGVTLRQLLTHHSGLANPEDTRAEKDGFPAYYRAPTTDLGYCLFKPATASAFSYNNCDYIVAAAEMNGITHWPKGMMMARAGANGVPGYVGGKPEPAFNLNTFGAAGGLIGTTRALFAFDRDLMTGKLLTPAARAELWKPEGGGSYQALGQWVFPGKLKGCAKPKRIVQRDGEIGGVQTRNYILPDDDIVVIMFTNRSADDFTIGEVWEGKGFAYDLLSAAACKA